jgi:hypothetical protein
VAGAATLYDSGVLRLFRAPVLAAFLLGASLTSTLAAAAPPSADVRASDQRKKDGDTLMSERRYADALVAYNEAYALSPNPVLHYNRARALQFLARYPESLEAFERFKAEAPESVRARVEALDELIAEVRRRVTTLEVRCNVDGAQVRLGDRVIGTTPLAKPVVVVAGEVQLEISAPGLASFTKVLKLPGDERVVVDATLEPLRTNATLHVTSRSTGAQVFVDGRPIGPTPATATVVPGLHALRVVRNGADPGSADIVLAAGEEKDVALDPIERPGVASRWWFWAGIGTVVAGGVALGIALTTERSGDRGTFSPSTLRVP